MFYRLHTRLNIHVNVHMYMHIYLHPFTSISQTYRCIIYMYVQMFGMHSLSNAPMYVHMYVAYNNSIVILLCIRLKGLIECTRVLQYFSPAHKGRYTLTWCMLMCTMYIHTVHYTSSHVTQVVVEHHI